MVAVNCGHGVSSGPTLLENDNSFTLSTSVADRILLTLCLEYRQWSCANMALLSGSGVYIGFREAFEAYRWV